MMLRRPRLKWRIAAALFGAILFLAVGLLPTDSAFPRVMSIGNRLFLYRVSDCYLLAAKPRQGEPLGWNFASPYAADQVIFQDHAQLEMAFGSDYWATAAIRPRWYGVRTIHWYGSTAFLVDPQNLRWFLLALLLPLVLALNGIRLRMRRWRRRVCATCAYPVYATPSKACPECGCAVAEPDRRNGVSYRIPRPRYLWRLTLAFLAISAVAGASYLPVGGTGAVLDVLSITRPSVHVYRVDEYYLITTRSRFRMQDTFGEEHDPDGDALLRYLGLFETRLLRMMSAGPVSIGIAAPRTWFGIEPVPWSGSSGLLIEPRRARWLLLAATLPLLAGLLRTILRARRRREQRCRRCGYLGIGDAAECPLCREPTGRRRSGRPRWAGSIVAAIAGAALFVGLSRPGERTHSLGLWARLHDVPLYVFSLEECLIFTTQSRAWDLGADELAIYRNEETDLVRSLVDDSLPMPWYGVRAVPWKGSTAAVIDRSRIRWAALLFGAPLLVTAIRWVMRRRARRGKVHP